MVRQISLPVSVSETTTEVDDEKARSVRSRPRNLAGAHQRLDGWRAQPARLLRAAWPVPIDLPALEKLAQGRSQDPRAPRCAAPLETRGRARKHAATAQRSEKARRKQTPLKRPY